MVNAWRDTKITIVVEIEGEQPLQLTQTYKNLHKMTPQVGIIDMANAFRIQADEREKEKPYNKKWLPMVSDIKRVLYSQWAGADLDGTEVLLSKIES